MNEIWDKSPEACKFIKSRSYKRHLKSIAEGMAGRHNIRIKFLESGDDLGYTDGKVIYVNLFPKCLMGYSVRDLMCAHIALIVHEHSHQLYSSWDICRKVAARELLKDINNILEDGRIERISAYKVPGWSPSLYRLNEIVSEVQTKGYNTEVNSDFQYLYWWLWEYAKVGHTPPNNFPNEEVKKAWKEIKQEVLKARYSDTPEPCYEASVRIEEILTPFKQKQPTPKPSEFIRAFSSESAQGKDAQTGQQIPQQSGGGQGQQSGSQQTQGQQTTVSGSSGSGSSNQSPQESSSNSSSSSSGSRSSSSKGTSQEQTSGAGGSSSSDEQNNQNNDSSGSSGSNSSKSDKEDENGKENNFSSGSSGSDENEEKSDKDSNSKSENSNNSNEEESSDGEKNDKADKSEDSSDKSENSGNKDSDSEGEDADTSDNEKDSENPDKTDDSGKESDEKGEEEKETEKSENKEDEESETENDSEDSDNKEDKDGGNNESDDEEESDLNDLDKGLDDFLDRLDDELDSAAEDFEEEKETEKKDSNFAQSVSAYNQTSYNERMEERYNERKARLTGLISNMKTKLFKTIHFNMDETTRKLTRGKVDGKSLCNVINGRICAQRKEKSDETDLNVTFLLDKSGSMDGYLETTTVDATIVVGEALEMLKIPYSILAFENYVYLYKEWRQSKARKYALMNYSSDGGTALDSGLKVVTDMMKKQSRYDKIVFVITDGYPNNTDTAIRAAETLRHTKAQVYGIAIGLIARESSSRKTFTRIFGEKFYIPCAKLEDLPLQLTKVVRKNLLR